VQLSDEKSIIVVKNGLVKKLDLKMAKLGRINVPTFSIYQTIFLSIYLSFYPSIKQAVFQS
jgi:hypothetical protein